MENKQLENPKQLGKPNLCDKLLEFIAAIIAAILGFILALVLGRIIVFLINPIVRISGTEEIGRTYGPNEEPVYPPNPDDTGKS
jgi:hypothetical protein